MPKKVLIAYGSRFGCTEEVSQEIAKILKEEGVDSSLLNLRKTKPKQWPSIEEFDGILIGSGIRIMKWTKESKKFLEMYKKELNEKGLGLFVCCALAATDQAQAKKDYLEKVIDELGITPDIYDAFGGVLDFSESSNMGFLDKKMLKMAAKAMKEEEGLAIEDDAKNDFRDWDQIRNFAEKIAALVKG
jgi:menaquinone-dependent protoporphyrinogen oxidase